MCAQSREPDVFPVVDSHQHFWDIAKFSYPWMPADGVLRRTYAPKDLEHVLKGNLVSKTVLVQAHKSVDEARYMLDIAKANDFVAGVVTWVDLAKPDVGKTLDELKKYPKLVGIRHPVHDETDDAWITRPEVIRGLKAVAERGLAYDLLVRTQHLKHVKKVADQAPGLRMVVDHIAKPPIAKGELEPWASEIAKVAALPNVYCKISGMVTEADHKKWKTANLRPYVEHVVKLFGYDRLMWGSDWPVVLLASDYDKARVAAVEAIGDCTYEEWAKLMGGTAIAFYKLKV
ncbi:MAG: hypothetical protein FJ319_07615 [SAR202 cluster bacterium]|nr:hypothetical protein [SAR202 cluster bacterium]